jgi:hypothetical protein
MKITINKKVYKLEFKFSFTKYVMDKNGWKSFAEYDKFLQTFDVDEKTFGPLELENFAALVLLGIECHTEDLQITSEDIVNEFWADMSLVQKVIAFFVSCQPKRQPVDPAKRGK